MLSVYISSISPSHTLTRLNMAFTCPAVGPHQHPRVDGEMPKRQRSVKPAMRSPEGPPATACHSTFRGLSGLMRQALKACQRLNVKNITPSPSENFAALPVESVMEKKTLKDTQLREKSSQSCW